MSSSRVPSLLKQKLVVLLAGGSALAALPAHAQDAGSAIQLNTVVVQTDGKPNKQSDGVAPVKGFVPKTTTTGSKDAVAIEKIPQSVSVVGRDQMDATGA